MSHDSTSDARPVNRRQPLRLADIVEDLLWPNLFRSVRLSLRPATLALGLLLVLLTLAIGDLGALWGDGDWLDLALTTTGAGGATFLEALLDLEGARALSAVSGVLFDLPLTLLRDHTMSLVLLTIPLACVWCLCTGAISRVAAIEYGAGVFMMSRSALGFAGPRLLSLIGAQFGTWIGAWLIVGAMAGAGWLLFSFPLVNTIGALLFPFFLLGGLLCAMILLLSLAGCPMFIPGVACEGVDALDAVQRVISMVVANPLRLLLYLLILGLIGLGAVFIVNLVIEGAVAISIGAGAAWSGERGEATMLGAGTAPEETSAPHDIVLFWISAMRLLGAAFLVSWYACASTLLFLMLREATTGQERTDIWMPGMIEATMAEAVRARGATVDEAKKNAVSRLGDRRDDDLDEPS